MRKFALFAVAVTFACGVQASWYWPFGSDGVDSSAPRISELMEPASELIDEASDLASDGKIDESVEKYRKALDELDRIERENPERAKSTEFATLRNKRAYVNAAIDSMLLGQVKRNAKVVAVSDTTELEKKLAEERGEKKVKEKGEGEGRKSKVEVEVEQRKKTSAVYLESSPSPLSAKPATKRERAIEDIANGDYAAAEIFIKESLEAKPNNAMALNLRAAMEMKQGKFDAAEKTLDLAISTHPKNPSAYYNFALLTLQKDGDNKSVARRYYETGRTMGGPADPQLEALLK